MVYRINRVRLNSILWNGMCANTIHRATMNIITINFIIAMVHKPIYNILCLIMINKQYIMFDYGFIYLILFKYKLNCYTEYNRSIVNTDNWVIHRIICIQCQRVRKKHCQSLTGRLGINTLINWQCHLEIGVVYARQRLVNCLLQGWFLIAPAQYMQLEANVTTQDGLVL